MQGGPYHVGLTNADVLDMHIADFILVERRRSMSRRKTRKQHQTKYERSHNSHRGSQNYARRNNLPKKRPAWKDVNRSLISEHLPSSHCTASGRIGETGLASAAENMPVGAAVSLLAHSPTRRCKPRLTLRTGRSIFARAANWYGRRFLLACVRKESASADDESQGRRTRLLAPWSADLGALVFHSGWNDFVLLRFPC